MVNDTRNDRLVFAICMVLVFLTIFVVALFPNNDNKIENNTVIATESDIVATDCDIVATDTDM